MRAHEEIQLGRWTKKYSQNTLPIGYTEEFINLLLEKNDELEHENKELKEDIETYKNSDDDTDHNERYG